MLATNDGLFGVSPDGTRARKIGGLLTVGRLAGTFGRKVSSLAFVGPDDLLASGHPDGIGSRLPGALGVLESVDGGYRWTSVSRLGFSDLHVLTVAGRAIYGYDTVLGGVIVSDSRGRAFTERSAPPALVFDLAVNPSDPRHLLAAGADTIYLSTDQGGRWRPLFRAPGAHLAWTAGGLVRADPDGQISKSVDGGQTWTGVGRLVGGPEKLVELDDGTLYVALRDGSVAVSSTGGRTWRMLFRPQGSVISQR